MHDAESICGSCAVPMHTTGITHYHTSGRYASLKAARPSPSGLFLPPPHLLVYARYGKVRASPSSSSPPPSFS